MGTERCFSQLETFPKFKDKFRIYFSIKAKNFMKPLE